VLGGNRVLLERRRGSLEREVKKGERE